MKRTYILMDNGADFNANSLSDIKSHIRMMSDRDKQNIEGCPIVGYNAKGDEVFCRFVRLKGSRIVFSKN